MVEPGQLIFGVESISAHQKIYGFHSSQDGFLWSGDLDLGPGLLALNPGLCNTKSQSVSPKAAGVNTDSDV